MGGTQIDLVLHKSIIDIHQRRVRIQITQTVVAVLGIKLHIVAAEPFMGEVTLHKRVLIELPLTVGPDIIDNRTRDPFVTVVEIPLDVPFAFGQIPEQTQFGSTGVDVSVLPHGGRVPGYRTGG